LTNRGSECGTPSAGVSKSKDLAGESRNSMVQKKRLHTEAFIMRSLEGQATSVEKLSDIARQTSQGVSGDF
jgi:hypothetical protein